MIEEMSIVDHLRHRAAVLGDVRGYTFLSGGELESEWLTYGELDRRSRAIAARLQNAVAPGSRVLLMYAPGLDFIAAFFACLYAGVVAVPAYPPPSAKPERCLPRLRSVASEADIEAILCTNDTCNRISELFAWVRELERCCFITTDQQDQGLAESWRYPDVRMSDVAFLQYTSGSTAAPKGVMVSHGNIIHNLQYLDHCIGDVPDSVGVSWLPTYHDMGLFGGVLLPLYKSYPSYLMSPISFLQKPARWLAAISRYRATMSGGPNFAYDLCADRISEDQLRGLDLSSWKIAYSGAEPIRKASLKRFWQLTSPYGFQRSSFHCVYGLAEATVFVTGKQLPDADVSADDTSGSENLVGCGPASFGTQLIIVHPEKQIELPDGETGEIWIQNGSVARGYWNRPQETEYAFRAQLADTQEGPYLRTGDLGFMHDGELFVTGRIKDLIIIRGRKFYPQDIEQTVELSHEFVLPNASAAISLPTEEGERLVIVAEIKRNRILQSASSPVVQPAKTNEQLDEVFGTIREAIAQQHDLQAFGISLVSRGTIPKTSSGKIQRHACRHAVITGNLDCIAQWMLQPLRFVSNAHSIGCVAYS